MTSLHEPSAYEPWDAARGAEIIAEHAEVEGATLVILHALQEAFGYIAGAGDSDGRCRAEPVARRSPWRGHLLSRLPPSPPAGTC